MISNSRIRCPVHTGCVGLVGGLGTSTCAMAGQKLQALEPTR